MNEYRPGDNKNTPISYEEDYSDIGLNIEPTPKERGDEPDELTISLLSDSKEVLFESQVSEHAFLYTGGVAEKVPLLPEIEMEDGLTKRQTAQLKAAIKVQEERRKIQSDENKERIDRAKAYARGILESSAFRELPEALQDKAIDDFVVAAVDAWKGFELNRQG